MVAMVLGIICNYQFPSVLFWLLEVNEETLNSAETMVQQIQKTYTHRCNHQIYYYPCGDSHTVFH